MKKQNTNPLFVRGGVYALLFIFVFVVRFALAQQHVAKPTGVPGAHPASARSSLSRQEAIYGRYNNETEIPSSPGPTATSTSTATPTATHTPTPCGQYWTSSGSLPIVPGTTDIGNHCDDCDTSVTLPFPFRLYGVTFERVMVSSNGRLDFLCNNEPVGGYSTCLPAGSRNCPFDYTIFPLWTELDTNADLIGCSTWANGCGIFTSISGTAPNRIFNIEWHALLSFTSNTPQDFEVRLYENDPNQRFDVIYGNVGNAFGLRYLWVGGVQGSPGFFTEDFCETGVSPPRVNTSRTYTLVPCASPTATPTPTATAMLTPTCTPGLGKIYNIGGWPGPNGNNRIYDISTNSWTTGAPLPITLTEHVVGYFNGKIYVTGGYSGSGLVNTLYIYDITSNTWNTGANMLQAVSLPGFGIINGKLYVASGIINNFEVNTLQIYDIASDSWTLGAPVPVAVAGPGSAVLQGQLYLFGGESPVPNTTATTQRYDPVTNNWAICGNMNVPRIWFYGAAVGNTTIVAPGGDNPLGNPLVENELGACVWNTMAPLPYPARGPFAVSDGTFVYIGGGDDGGSARTDTLRYDPIANTYTPLAPAPDAHYLSQAVFVPNPCGVPQVTPTSTPTATPTVTAATPTATPTATVRPTPTARPNVTPRVRPTPPPRP